MYNRDYLSHTNSDGYTTSNPSEGVGSGSRASMMAFLKATYQLFAGSLLAATAGAYVGLDMVSVISSWYWGFVILEFVLLFGLQRLLFQIQVIKERFPFSSYPA